ncbi:hypothetical protein D3C78_1919710 [compost metagenome]
MQYHLQNSAFSYSCCFALRLNANICLYSLIHIDLMEVDMHNMPAHRVALDFRHHDGLLALGR